MDTSEPNQDEGSWIPSTPFLPILTKPAVIYTDKQGNQLDPTNNLGPPKGISSGSIQHIRVDKHGEHSNFTNHNWEATLRTMGIAASGGETCMGRAVDYLARWENVAFASPMKPTEAGSKASRGMASHSNGGLPPGPNILTDSSYMQGFQFEVPIAYGDVCDLNLPPRRMTDLLSSQRTSQFAPLTPKNTTGVEGKQRSYEQDGRAAAMGVEINRVQSEKELQQLAADSKTAAGPMTIQENHDSDKAATNCANQNKTPQQKPRRKKHRPRVITEGKPRTPKPATPKVAGEGNPAGKRKYVRKNALNKVSTSPPAQVGEESTDPNPQTPTPGASEEKPMGKRKYFRKSPGNKDSTSKEEAIGESTDPRTGTSKCKRKYVRKNPVNKASTSPAEGAIIPETPELAASTRRKNVQKNSVHSPSTAPPEEPNEESSDPKTLEPPKNSCRRALNFDLEEPKDESSICRPISEAQEGQGQTRESQSKSIVHLGHGIEVIIETTQAGIAHDLIHSMDKMLKDYISMPEIQAQSVPVPAEAIPPEEKGNADSQENDTKLKDCMATHYACDNTIQIMLHTDAQFSLSSNASNCSISTHLSGEGQEKELKRKRSGSIEQSDTCSTNMTGIYYNELPAFVMGSCGNVPSICRKKKTEKEQLSTTSSVSCLMTTAKEIADPSTSKLSNDVSAPQSRDSRLRGVLRQARSGQRYQLHELSNIISHTERPTKKRSKAPAQVQALASLTGISGCTLQTPYPAKQAPVGSYGQQVGNSGGPYSCIEALTADVCSTLTTKKRTKKKVSLTNSVSSTTSEEQAHRRTILYSQNQFSAKSLAFPKVLWKETFSVDAIAEQLKNLDINRESRNIVFREQNACVPYNMENEMQNALVVYGRDGTIVPFEPIKKRHPRPKVDLDEETSKVWKLLMVNINNEGINGTNEEKAKWWEEEREVFRGRADSFIARMHLVQGDRRFTQWKGSVLDSVIGVFLTQNVSDHLSSSAFMSLAAHFPLKLKSENRSCNEERNSVNDKPIVHVLDPEDITKWNEEISNESICDQSSMIIHNIELDEEREAVNSNESSGSNTVTVSSGTSPCAYHESPVNGSTTEITDTGKVSYIGEQRAENYALSSQNSVISSQHSEESPVTQTTERKESLLENNFGEDPTDISKLNSRNGYTSFTELLQKAECSMLYDIHVQGIGNFSSDQNSKEGRNKTNVVGNGFQRQETDIFNYPKSSMGASMVPSGNCHSHPTSNLGVLGTKFFEMVSEETGHPDTSKNKGKNPMEDHGALAPESLGQITDTMNIQETAKSTTNNSSWRKIQEGEHLPIQCKIGIPEDPKLVGKSVAQERMGQMHQNIYLPKVLGGTPDITESTSDYDKRENNPQITKSDVIEHEYSEGKVLNEMNAANRKAKSRRVGKEIKENIDWDALRKQAEEKGRKREGTANTRDSLDYEAVRCADVSEIANTIKERGMNNLLAERIKDFLNRLVREHGSLDLEWLRDVPPDKAKEYLLSIRGLGLKSVECVRLLTLHHLAFPVDTNVGRIAVRLGWVPLQPLPESLQLHLLELYPVLESIQKYLWPRLCKLDQRTLYELHYQLITFGKVFCTKSKPNCNACPMRGECRHFASAFASARLALPGPEEKGIMSVTDTGKTNQNPVVIVDRLPLPLPMATEKSENSQVCEATNQSEEADFVVSKCEPIIEEPSSPEPECKQVTENDIEDTFCEDPDEIPMIKLNIEEFTQNLQNYMQENMELQEVDMSKALVALTAEAASIPTPKLKNVSRLRTEHQVYELPDSHPLLQGLDRRETDDPCSYLLAIWTPGETADSIQPPERRCSSQECGKLCDEKTCFSCNSIREADSQIVRGTLLIPCRTAMRGSFPLNGTYFQVNEVFADHDSSLNPIDVPRSWLWNLPRRTVYFGTSIPTIFKGMTTESIQQCFWRGYVCVRGFDQKTRAPRPLMARLHFPASKLNRTKGKDVEE